MDPRIQRQRRLGRAGLVIAALGLAAGVALLIAGLTGQLAEPELPGLAVYTGPTVWLLPVTRVVADAAAVATVGCLLAAAFLAPGLRTPLTSTTPGRRLLLAPAGFRWVRAAFWAVLLWVVASCVGLVLSASDLLGIPPTAALRPTILFDTARSVTQGQTLLWTIAITCAVAVACRVIRTVNGAALALVGALVAVTPAAFAGHAAGAGSHQLAVSAQILHVVPVTLWLGGLLALVLGSRRLGADRPAMLRRYSALAAACLVLVAVSGVPSLAVRLRDWSDLLDTAYGRVALVKIVVLLIAGALGWLHRARCLPALEAGRSRTFARLAAVEIGVLAVGIGAAVGLAATPAPRV
ncbi:MAG: copper resistance D family protein, partial [Mycobacteriales bacterium]